MIGPVYLIFIVDEEQLATPFIDPSLFRMAHVSPFWILSHVCLVFKTSFKHSCRFPDFDAQLIMTMH